MSSKCYFCHSQFANLEAEGRRWIGTKGCGGGICEGCLADGCRDLGLAAEAVGGVVVIRAETLPDGVRVLVVPCGDYERMPQAVEHGGRLYGRTGWDSDRMVAFYRTDAAVARPSKQRGGSGSSAMKRLFGACGEDWHYQVLEELCFRAGLLWRCSLCGFNNGEGSESCEDCGLGKDPS